MNNLSWQLEYMYGLERFGVRMGLEIMQELMQALGRPHEKFKSVHISGTNGKGSTAILTANALQEGNYKTGLYTSPHLFAFNERIRVNGEEISDEELSGLIEEVQRVVEERNLAVTFFEFTTALAFLYFANQKVDIAVVEVGLGGDLDATNVILPLAAAITNIGHDHTQILGRTKREIARHKAGIFKKGITAISGEKDPEISEYLEQLAGEQGAAFGRVQDTVTLEPLSATLEGQTFRAHGVYEGEFFLPLLGRHQLANAACALTILFYLNQQGVRVDEETIARAFARTEWEGRLTVISKQPLILVDGAHNEEGIQVLRDFLTQEKSNKAYHASIYGREFRSKVLVVAMKKDKEPGPMLEKIVPLFEKIIVTEGSFEPKPAGELAAEVSRVHKNVAAIPKTSEAILAARKDLESNDLLLVTGSLYMIGGALAALKQLTLVRSK